jgi:hypothetical protein
MPLTIDLLATLARFENVDDYETALAFYRTRVPAVGRLAYLNSVYKPAPPEVRHELDDALGLTSELRDFYAQWNGVRLFFDLLSIYGCLPRRYLLDRADPTDLLPFDLRQINAELAERLSGTDLVCIGAYGYDRSRVYQRRATGEVICAVGDDQVGDLRGRWPSLREWLASEIPRVAACFDPKGRRLVPPERSLPGALSRCP